MNFLYIFAERVSGYLTGFVISIRPINRIPLHINQRNEKWQNFLQLVADGLMAMTLAVFLDLEQEWTAEEGNDLWNDLDQNEAL